MVLQEKRAELHRADESEPFGPADQSRPERSAGLLRKGSFNPFEPLNLRVRAAGLRVQGLAESDEPASRRRIRALLFRHEETGAYVLRP